MASKNIKYIGRTTDFKGKTLWEIVGDLKDYGVGRMVIRNMFQRYPEPCYMRILKVQTLDDVTDKSPDNVRKVKVLVQKTWRGVTLPKPIEIYSSSYKADYELIDKDDEHIYLNNTKKIPEKILSNEVEFPPLMREFVMEKTGQTDLRMKTHFKPNYNKFVRLAKDGEEPTIKMIMGLGEPKPISRKLYEGLL